MIHGFIVREEHRGADLFIEATPGTTAEAEYRDDYIPVHDIIIKDSEEVYVTDNGKYKMFHMRSDGTPYVERILELETHFKDFLEMHNPFRYAEWISGLWTINEFLEINPQLKRDWKRYQEVIG